MGKNIKKVIGFLGCSLSAALFARAVGKAVYARTPKGGINESMYIDVNGSKQWINIYGKDKNNPVLLYLHGGPGSSSSHIDYAFTRKWSDVYTVVTWDQRNCGKSYDRKQNGVALTKELFLSDGKQVTAFIRQYLSKEKLTILGHSWGSIYGANLVQEYPDDYACFIGAGQLVDYLENEKAFIAEALRWAKSDKDVRNCIHRLDPEHPTAEYFKERNMLMEQYGYGMMANGRDYPLVSTVIRNPNYSLWDWMKYLQADMRSYYDFLCSEEFRSFSLKGKTEYSVPYYNINGDRDYQTNYRLAEAYFEQVHAPRKRMFLMKDMTHGLLESDSEGFSEIIHQIAKMERGR